MTRTIVLWLIGATFLIGGCALTPDYERPELDLPDDWVRTAGSGRSVANLPWWEVYGDPALVSLIETALEQNQDLAVALARMQESRYLVTFTRADQFPFLDVFGGAGRGRQSKEIFSGAKTDNNFSVGANISFEVDLWRRYARATEGARADLLSTEAAYRNVTINLISDVASAYLILRDFDSRLEISRYTLEGRVDRLGIVRARFEMGTVAELDVNQAEVQVSIAEASIAQFERLVAQTEHALRVLLGEFPGQIPRGEPITIDSWPLSVPAGLPSELLQRRPDIVAAEQVLIAETARVGVAQAMRFPAISLTAEISAVAEGLADLNSFDAGEWNVLAGIFQPLFNSGQLKAQMKAQRARAEQAQHNFIGTLQNAFREVENSLVAIVTYRKEYLARERQVRAAANTVRLSRARYDGGVVDYLEVLDSERTLFSAELAESAIRRDALISFVLLYKALGGGWSPSEDEAGEEGVAATAGVEEGEEVDEAEEVEGVEEAEDLESMRDAEEGDDL